MITIPIRGAFVLVLSLLVTIGIASRAQAQTVFRVTLAPGVLGDAPVVAGRLIVALAHEGANISRRTSPLDAPFWDDPQPIFGASVSMKPGEAVIVDDAATSFASKPSALKPGKYRAAAWLVANQATSKWRGVPGNAYSEVVEFVVPEPPGVGGPVDITLATATREPERRWRPGQVEEFVVRSALLSAFHGREVVLRAGVVLPAGGMQEGRRYPAVYHVPGFGGRHDEALSVRRAVARSDGDLDRNVLHIYLDPESPNGHTLFADSANNGPWNRALVEELIPALEKQYPLISEPTARVLRGHSSGGWSVVWLGVNNPQTFGFAWSTAPDPVCFSRFQLVDIYRRANMFVPAPGEPVGPGDIAGTDTPSYRRGGAMKMTIRQEAGGEEVLGPDATSGQQWASWQAVFGPRDDRGRIVELFDHVTGAINPAVLDHYRGYDITHLLRTRGDVVADRLINHVRIIVGDADNFFLEQACMALRDELQPRIDARRANGNTQEVPGGVIIVPGLDHGSVFGHPSVRRIPAEMLAYFRAAGHVPPAVDEPKP